MVTPIWDTTKKQGCATIVISENAQETMGVKWWSDFWTLASFSSHMFTCHLFHSYYYCF
jgi:hypothetical protein